MASHSGMKRKHLMEEREVLASLFRACGGSEWTNNDNWLKEDVALSDWFGVQTDSTDQSVTGLELSDNNIKGNMDAFATAASQLDQLDQLWLSNNHELVGSLSSSLVEDCPKLSILDVGNCALTGILPAAFINNPKFSWIVTDGNELSPFERYKEGDSAALILELFDSTIVLGSLTTVEKTIPNLSKVYMTPQTLSPEISKSFIDSAEASAHSHGGWSTGRHKRHSTTDIDCAEESGQLLSLVNPALRYTLLPLIAKLYNVDPLQCTAEDVFVVKYCPSSNYMKKENNETYSEEGQSSLAMHRDGSELSFVINLNDPTEFEGGGTSFYSASSTKSHSASSSPTLLFVATPETVGSCVSFCGLQQHGGMSVTAGVRYILAGFVRVHDSGKLRREATDLFM